MWSFKNDNTVVCVIYLFNMIVKSWHACFHAKVKWIVCPFMITCSGNSDEPRLVSNNQLLIFSWGNILFLRTFHSQEEEKGYESAMMMMTMTLKEDCGDDYGDDDNAVDGDDDYGDDDNVVDNDDDYDDDYGDDDDAVDSDHDCGDD